MILITGASGTVGRAVLEEVREAGKPFKAMYRNAEDAKKAPPGVPTVLADFADKIRPSWCARRFRNWSNWKAT
jgi:uncharacterized protein YbjT (DUF2867 family)